jgi:serine protease AprX
LPVATTPAVAQREGIMSVSGRPVRSAFKRFAAFIASAGLVTGGMAAVATPAAASTPINVIIQGGAPSILQTYVSLVGGHTVTQLPLVNGILAQVPSSFALTTLQTLGLVTSPDAPVAVDAVAGALPATAPSGSNAFPAATGATKLAEQGITGAGVGVAVLDTGIASLPDFNGRLVGGVDFSGGGNPFQDNYGHGTFVAGLIAGDGSSSAGAYTGEATGANLVSVKIAGSTGTSDVATVIQGIAWTVANRATYGIKILNLSLGEVPTGPTQLNPLDQAVEAAWRAGITVVTSAGNSGPAAGTITAPGDDPYVITVGALDDAATPAADDDSIASFSSEGPTAANAWLKPDLVAAGRSVVSLRAPGSTIDQTYPSAQVGSSNFVGSGTSFSTAITSGAAALVAQQNPNASPDGIKGRLLATATPGPTGDVAIEGHGDLDAYDAATCPPVRLSQLFNAVAMPAAPGVLIPLITTWVVSGWDPINYTADITSNAWNSNAWNSNAWNSNAWNSNAWNSNAWNSSAWNSNAWNSNAWNSNAWNSNAWNSNAWNSSTWQ